MMKFDPITQKIEFNSEKNSSTGITGSGLTAVDMSQWDIADGDIHVETGLQGGNYYYCDYPVTILTFEGIEKTLSEIIIQFTCAGSITFPDTLKWIGSPSFEAGKTYVISIINNIAVAGEIV